MNLYIFRHGETMQTKEGLLYGDQVKTAEILPEGKAVIEKIANHLKNLNLDVCYSSPYKRCRQTVAIVESIINKPFEFDERLGEFLLDQGETFSDCAKRVKNFYDELIKQNFQNVAVCTHGGTIAALKYYATQREFTLDDLHEFPQPGVIVVIKNGQITEINFN